MIKKKRGVCRLSLHSGALQVLLGRLYLFDRNILLVSFSGGQCQDPGSSALVKHTDFVSEKWRSHDERKKGCKCGVKFD